MRHRQTIIAGDEVSPEKPRRRHLPRSSRLGGVGTTE
jgi:hypothetical protein